MKNLFLFFSFASFLFNISCTDDTTAPDNSLQYVKGDLLVGITSQTEVEAVFDLMNRLNFSIDHMSGFFYYSSWPEDSINFLVDYLSSIKYLNSRGFSISENSVYYYQPENKIRVLTFFFDMNKVNQMDWLEQLEKLDLIGSNGENKDMLIKVPVGTEIFWQEKLKENEIIRWTQLNYIGGIVPH